MRQPVTRPRSSRSVASGGLLIGSLLLLGLLLSAQQRLTPVIAPRSALNLGGASAAIDQPHANAGPIVGHAIKADTSARLDKLPARRPQKIETEREEEEGKTTPWFLPLQDPVIQSKFAGPLDLPPLLHNFPAMNQGEALADIPDTTGDVGPDHYVQWVNWTFSVYDKTSGARLYGPAAGNTLWQGFGGICDETNRGDPQVNYDPLADRWVMAQLAFNWNGFSIQPPYMECIAVSQTPDPLGAWYRYAFNIGAMNGFDDWLADYGKLGVWPSGYFMSFSMFSGLALTAMAYTAFDRAAMLAGRPDAAVVYFHRSLWDGFALPADFDGITRPPANAPNPYIALPLNRSGISLYKFTVDWANPAAATFSEPIAISSAPYNYPCPDSPSAYCVPQPETSGRLDVLADRPMQRLSYRNFGTYQMLLFNHSVGANGASGVRWYEIRDPLGTPTVFQQGTFAPDDGIWRWMGSIAMDHLGNIALGYNVSNRNLSPGIRYTARQVDDPAGTMPRGEAIIADGASWKPGSRWGDYSAMQVDPADDCTFWYTSMRVSAYANWDTSISSFKFPNCTYVKATRTATRTPTTTKTPTVTRTPTLTPTRTATGTATASRTATPSATNTPTGTATPSSTPTGTPTASATNTRTPSRTPSASATTTRTRTATPTASRTPTRTITRTPTASRTATRTATTIPTATCTATASPTRTATATASATITRTPTASATVTRTPSRTSTASRTPTRTATRTATASRTATHTATLEPTTSRTTTASRTPTASATLSPTPSRTPSASATATRTRTVTPTASRTPTRTLTSTVTASRTATRTVTRTPTLSRTPTRTLTSIPTRTATPSSTPTRTATLTRTPTRTATTTPCAIRFADVPPDDLYYSPISCLACQGIISGYACGGPNEPCDEDNSPYFRAYNNLTRGQAAKIITLAAGFGDAIAAQQSFADVLPNSPFWLFIERARLHNLIGGYDCGAVDAPCDADSRPYFRWGAILTRGQAVKMITTAAGFNEAIPATQQSFADVPPNNAFWPFIERARAHNIISGYDCGSPNEPCDARNRPYFRWGSPLRRGQAAKIIAAIYLPDCRTPRGE